jgi:GntR family histidine utilization transcriptional repressor
VEAAPVAVALRLNLPPATPLRHVQSLHLADGRPFVHEDRWLNPAVLNGQAVEFAAQSANEWLVAHVPYATGDIAFSAMAAGPADAAVFDVPPGTPLFLIERTTWTGTAAPITLVRLAYAPGHRMHTRL